MIVAVCAFAAVAVLVALRASLHAQEASFPSTYDFGPNGYAALYAFLAREDVADGRFESDPSRTFGVRGTMVVAGDAQALYFSLDSHRVSAYAAWVKAGNRLIVLGPLPPWSASTLGVPACAAGSAPCGARRDRTLLRLNGSTVAVEMRRGKGSIVAAASPAIFDNEHLARDGNAAFAYTLFAVHAPVYFDETIHGYTEGKSFWQVLPLPARAAIVLAVASVVLAISGANLPFAPPQLQPQRDGGDTGEYLIAVARMLERARSARDVVQRLSTHVSEAVRPHALTDEHARVLLERARNLQAIYSPDDEDLLAAGHLYAEVRKDYLC
jgi:hypothetical protein